MPEQVDLARGNLPAELVALVDDLNLDPVTLIEGNARQVDAESGRGVLPGWERHVGAHLAEIDHSLPPAARLKQSARRRAPSEKKSPPEHRRPCDEDGHHDVASEKPETVKIRSQCRGGPADRQADKRVNPFGPPSTGGRSPPWAKRQAAKAAPRPGSGSKRWTTDSPPWTTCLVRQR